MPTRRQVLEAVRAAAATLSSVEQALIGAPTGLPYQRTVYVALGGPNAEHHTTGTLRVVDRIIAAMAYDVGADNQAAVLNVADYCDQLQDYIYSHKTLGGLVKDARLVPAGPADYEAVAGSEALVYPAVVQVMYDVAFTPDQP